MPDQAGCCSGNTVVLYSGGSWVAPWLGYQLSTHFCGSLQPLRMTVITTLSNKPGLPPPDSLHIHHSYNSQSCSTLRKFCSWNSVVKLNVRIGDGWNWLRIVSYSGLLFQWCWTLGYWELYLEDVRWCEWNQLTKCRGLFQGLRKEGRQVGRKTYSGMAFSNCPWETQ